MEEKQKLIDNAIESCTNKANYYKKQSMIVLYSMISIAVGFLGYIFYDRISSFNELLAYVDSMQAEFLGESAGGASGGAMVTSGSEYLIFGGFILIFSILSALYRFFIKEVSKFEHIELGFIRIRIAGNNSITGFEDYVKKSLTHNAFSSNMKDEQNSEGRFESPVPGHPGSELATEMLNKILDRLEKNKEKNKE